ncbi:hypothetical protein [Larkinella terrae]|uniref:Uncharacterized protein n=1 Tax=Larkinella terrae TaxID=2025311 RepID=A0A7K0EJK5_9BACT|nr:hypothetical protein [Larkinella terrae]MRS61636.1 hypothetical protein [Larkinella terrae]
MKKHKAEVLQSVIEQSVSEDIKLSEFVRLLEENGCSGVVWLEESNQQKDVISCIKADLYDPTSTRGKSLILATTSTGV